MAERDPNTRPQIDPYDEFGGGVEDFADLTMGTGKFAGTENQTEPGTPGEQQGTEAKQVDLSGVSLVEDDEQW